MFDVSTNATVRTLDSGPSESDDSASIYFHYPCFDGLASAAIAMDFLTSGHAWRFARICPVNYDLKDRWLELELPKRSAVVDFLYQPQADFWADHHPTTFANDAAKQRFLNDEQQRKRWLFYDKNAASCAGLLFTHLAKNLSDPGRYAEMAAWAEKIDSADYASVEEAVHGTNAALEINLSLSVDANSHDYADLLLQSMSTMTLDATRELPEVQRRIVVARRRTQSGLLAVERSIRIVDDEIAVFSARESKNVTINRYSPYLFYPNAAYSVALVWNEGNAKVTAMRNPWRHFQSKPLGDIFRAYGGGGHERVASVLLTRPHERAARTIRDAIVAELRSTSASSLAV